MILQKDLSGPALAARIRYYFEHREELRRMEHNSRAWGRPDATEHRRSRRGIEWFETNLSQQSSV
jgi:hypothetical protein